MMVETTRPRPDGHANVTRILLIEDVAADARLVRETLSAVRGGPFEVEWCGRLEDGLRMARGREFDLLLLDLGLPDSRGIATLRRAVEAAPVVAIVVLTGLDDEELAAEALQQGAQDYLDKGRLDPEILARTLRHAIERKKAGAALHRENALLRVMQVTATAANVARTPASAYAACLDAICDLMGWEVGRVYEASPSADVLLPSDIWSIRRHEEGPIRAFREATERTPLAMGVGLPGRVFRTGKPECVGDLEADEGSTRSAAATQSGLRSAFALPVMAGPDVVAVLEFFSSRKEAPDARLLDVAAHVGTQLGRAVERERADAALRQLNEDLERRVAKRTADLAAANKELESFSYSVSHDLRAPLRAIDGFSRILLDGHAAQLDPRGLELLRKVRAASQRMGRLIDDLLELSRVGRTRMRSEELDLTDMARTILAELIAVDPHRVVDLHLEEGLRAKGDPTLLRCALENLLSNAWKFTSKHEHARIELGARDKEGTRVFFVRDDGAGFEPAYVDKLFRPFQRLHTDAEFEGTGIGLATVHRIVMRHGGRVWAEGEPELGATVYFTLQEGGAPNA